MTAGSQEVLTQALAKLQSELEQFDGIQKALKKAEQRLVEADQEWRKNTAEQQRAVTDLARMTKTAIEGSQVATQQSSKLASSLIQLAKAIENVNFPMRLDKIDIAVTTQFSSITSFQSEANRRFDEIQQINDRTIAAVASVQKSIVWFGRASIVIGLLGVSGIIAIFLKLYMLN